MRTLKTLSLLIIPVCFAAATSTAQLVEIDFETPLDLENNFSFAIATPELPDLPDLSQVHFIPDYATLAAHGQTSVYAEDPSNTYVQHKVPDHFRPSSKMTFTGSTFDSDVTVGMDIGATFSGGFAVYFDGLADEPLEFESGKRAIIVTFHLEDAAVGEDAYNFNLRYFQGGTYPDSIGSADFGTEPTFRASELDVEPPRFYSMSVGMDRMEDGSALVTLDVNGVSRILLFPEYAVPHGAFTVSISGFDDNTQAGGSYLDNFSVSNFIGIAAVPESDFTGALLALGVCGLIVVSAARKRGPLSNPERSRSA